MHASEDDHPVARSLDLLFKNLEPIRLAQAQILQLGLNQPLGRILQTLLHFPDTHRQHRALAQAILDQ